MYYENRKTKNFTIFFILIIFSLIIICLLLFKISISSPEIKDVNYEVTKTSMENTEEAKEKVDIKEMIENATKCVVGISKIEQNGTSIFLKQRN